MTDVPMFDVPDTRPCARCGRPDRADGSDVCAYCLHLDHTANPGGCPWCADKPVGLLGGRAAAGAGGRAAAAADPVVVNAATRALDICRMSPEPFTAADVRDLLESWDVAITTPSALGAVFTAARAAGKILPTDEFRPSPIRGQHGRPLRVWVAA